MPLDPRIILGAEPPKIESPLVMLSQIAHIQQSRGAAEKQQVELRGLRQAEADQAAIRQVLTETNGDMEQALPKLRTIAPAAAMKFETDLATQRKAKLEALKSETDNRSARMTFGLKVWQSVTDQPTLDVARPMVLAIDPSLEAILPKVYDPAAIERITNMGLTAKELHDQQRAGLDAVAKGDRLKGWSMIFGATRNQQQWDNAVTGARAVGEKPEILALFGDTFSPEAVQHATRLGISSEKGAELAQATTQTHNMRLPGVGDVPVDYVPDKTGKTGGHWLYRGQDVTDRVRAIPAASIQVQALAARAVADLPAWALDDSRPSGAEANRIDPRVRMTPNGLYQAAATYIATGQFPPTGRGNDAAAQAVRAAITSKVGAIAAASGMDEPTLRAFYKSNTASLTQQQKLYDAAQAFMATADKNTALLEQTLAKLPDVGVPAFNGPLRELDRKYLGDPNVAQFATYLRSVQNEYAKIISQPTLAGQLSDAARHEAETLIRPDATVKQIMASVQALKAEGANRLLSVGEQIQQIQQRMQSGGGPASTGPTAAKEGDVKPIPGYPGTEQTYRNGKWIRTK